MRILPKDTFPLSEEFNSALIADQTNGTQKLALVRESVNIPITGMLSKGDSRFVYGRDGIMYDILPTDDLVVLD